MSFHFLGKSMDMEGWTLKLLGCHLAEERIENSRLDRHPYFNKGVKRFGQRTEEDVITITGTRRGI